MHIWLNTFPPLIPQDFRSSLLAEVRSSTVTSNRETISVKGNFMEFKPTSYLRDFIIITIYPLGKKNSASVMLIKYLPIIWIDIDRNSKSAAIKPTFLPLLFFFLVKCCNQKSF